MSSLQLTPSRCTFIVKETDNRPEQTGLLATIPAEIILSIVEKIDGPVSQDIKSLALSSARLFSILRPYYYQSGIHLDFVKALFTADVPRLERNLEFAPFPKDGVWHSPREGCQCEDCTEKHTRHRPIDIFLWGLNKGVAKPQERADVLIWLYSKGYKINNWYNRGKHGKITNIMPETFVNLLQRDISKAKAISICEMIRFLSHQGISLPLWICPDRSPAWYRETASLQDFVPDFHPGTVYVNAYHTTTIEVALRSHCPPMLLEVLLQEYSRRNCAMTSMEMDTKAPPESLKDWYDAQMPLINNNSPWFLEIPFDNILAGLYADLMEPTGWEEEYQGQTADIWMDKIRLLVRFKAISKHELVLFASVLKALRAIAELPKITKSATFNPCWSIRHAEKTRWLILCQSVKRFVTMPEFQSVWTTWVEPESPEKIRRPHRFVLCEQWNPWKNWYLSRKKRELWKQYCEAISPGSYSEFNRYLHVFPCYADWRDLVFHAETSDELPS